MLSAKPKAEVDKTDTFQDLDYSAYHKHWIQ